MNIEQLYKENYEGMHRYAFTIVRDYDAASDIVQESFIGYYQQLGKGQIIAHPKAYLYRSVYNKSITYFNQLSKNKTLPVDDKKETIPDESFNKLGMMISDEEVSQHKRVVNAAMALLPGQCRTVFEKSRFEGKKYREIAEELHISEKTVEAHISKALKIIRDFIRVHADKLSLLLLIVLYDVFC